MKTQKRDAMEENVRFPITEERFLSYQERGTGRVLTHKEREALAGWVPVFNTAFDDGLEGRREEHEAAMKKVAGFIDGQGHRPVLWRFLCSCRYWMDVAYGQGREICE